MEERPPARQVPGLVRSCREPVWGEHQAYNCELPDLHDGPCMNLSVKASIQRRDAWEDAKKQTAGEDASA